MSSGCFLSRQTGALALACATIVFDSPAYATDLLTLNLGGTITSMSGYIEGGTGALVPTALDNYGDLAVGQAYRSSITIDMDTGAVTAASWNTLDGQASYGGSDGFNQIGGLSRDEASQTLQAYITLFPSFGGRPLSLYGTSLGLSFAPGTFTGNGWTASEVANAIQGGSLIKPSDASASMFDAFCTGHAVGSQTDCGTVRFSLESVSAMAVPEPSAWALMALGMCAIGWTRRRG